MAGAVYPLIVVKSNAWFLQWKFSQGGEAMIYEVMQISTASQTEGWFCWAEQELQEAARSLTSEDSKL
jgi:hypothetical protein